jgi:hypothetical protein
MKLSNAIVSLIFLLVGCSFLSPLPLQDPIHPAFRIETHFFEVPPISSWIGIIPGKTTVNEAKLLFSDQIGTSLVYTSGVYSGSIVGNDKHHRVNVSLVYDNNIITRIDLGGPMDLKLSDVINNFGSTEYNIIIPDMVPPNREFVAELEMYYPKQGYKILFGHSGGLDIRQISEHEVEICFEEDDYAHRVLIVPSSSSINELLINLGYGENGPGFLSAIRKMEGWPGFICVRYPF